MCYNLPAVGMSTFIVHRYSLLSRARGQERSRGGHELDTEAQEHCISDLDNYCQLRVYSSVQSWALSVFLNFFKNKK